MDDNTLDGSCPTVLVGSTLGPDSDHVVGTALAIARHSRGRVLLLHVLEPQGEVAAGLLSFAMVREGVTAAARERLCAQLRRLGARTSEVAGVAVELPPVSSALLGAAQRSRADQLVLGASDDELRSRRNRPLFLQLLRRLPRPVCLVRGHGPLAPALVLAPVDLATLPPAALDCCLEVLASCFPVAATEVVALCVLADDDPRQLVEAQHELDWALTGYAERFAGRLRGIVRRGPTAPVVSAAAAEEGADLVLLARCRNPARGRDTDRLVESLAREGRRAVLLVPIQGQGCHGRRGGCDSRLAPCALPPRSPVSAAAGEPRMGQTRGDTPWAPSSKSA